MHTVWFHSHKVLEHVNLSVVTECKLLYPQGKVISGDFGKNQKEWITNWQKKILGGDRYVHHLDRGDSFMGIHTSYQIIYFKYVWFIMLIITQ